MYFHIPFNTQNQTLYKNITFDFLKNQTNINKNISESGYIFIICSIFIIFFILFILLCFICNIINSYFDCTCNCKKKIRNNIVNKKIKQINKEHFNINNCVICFENLENINLIYLNCNHIFHKNCLQEWYETQYNNNLEPICPICRESINYTIY